MSCATPLHIKIIMSILSMVTELWTEKYKPKNLSEIAGQNKTVQEVLSWLSTWKPGKALFLHGPPGIGKNLIIETIAKERGYDILQLNASDERKPKDIQSFLGNISNVKPLFHKGRFIVIDEADGISGRSDRGAVTSIVKIVKESRFPVFIIANDPWKQKLKPLRTYCKLVKVDKVRSPSIEKRLKEICTREDIGYKPESLKNLARWAHGDMRSVINDLQIICHGKKCLVDKDMESLGFRERQNTLYNILPTIFHSGRIKLTSSAIWDSDKDPDEIFWWIENNIYSEIKDPENLIRGLDVLSKADMFRALVSKQQNWRFKAFMVDMMSSVSLFRGESHGYVAYKPPKKIIEMGRTVIKRAMIKSLAKRVGPVVHGSTSSVKRDYFPLLKILIKHPTKIDGTKNDYTIELEDEDIKLLS